MKYSRNVRKYKLNLVQSYSTAEYDFLIKKAEQSKICYENKILLFTKIFI